MDDVAAVVERIERGLAQMWSRQSNWLPGGRVIVSERGTVVLNDCVPSWLRGPVMYLSGPTEFGMVDEALEIASSVGRVLSVDLMRGVRGEVADHLRTRGFEKLASRRLMAAADRHRWEVASSCRLAKASDLVEMRLVQEKAFTMSPATAAALYPPDIFSQDQTQVVVKVYESTVVATATVHHDNGLAGLFGIACDPTQPGRGHGSAVTCATARLGFDRGADICWLQADDDVAEFYERLGFETIDMCDVWVSAYV